MISYDKYTDDLGIYGKHKMWKADVRDKNHE